MATITAHMHVTLDGYAAGPKGEMDWILHSAELFESVHELTDRTGVALYGRKTWMLMDQYWPTAADKPDASEHDKIHAAWYKSVPHHIISASRHGEVNGLDHFWGEDVLGYVRRLKEESTADILLLGSPSIQRLLMQEGLIDTARYYVNPVLLGGGIRVFPELTDRLVMQRKEVQTFGNGVVALEFDLQS